MQIIVEHVTRPVAGELSPEGAADDNSCKSLEDKQDEALDWRYMSRKEIMENSPSRRDGINWKKETSLRKSYCTFLQELGMRLGEPQVIIATAIVFCHRFFLRQSHAKNDRWTIATVCLFLAGKVKETHPPIKDIILISYGIIHKKDPDAAHRIQKKEVYEQRKKLILLAERVVVITLGFDFTVRLPYSPLVEAIKKFNVTTPALVQVAWNFVNDGLRTLLCLQFKPHQIAAGAIFLAAKFLNVNLPSDGEKVWWQEFDVTSRQLEEVINQLLDLYEWNRVPTSEASEVELSAGVETGATEKAPVVNAEKASKQEVSSHSAPKHTSAENLEVQVRGTGNQSIEIRDSQNSEQLPQKDNEGEVTHGSDSGTEQVTAGDHDRIGGTNEAAEFRGGDDLASNKPSCDIGRNLELREGLHCRFPSEVIRMIDKNKVKTALERWRKERGKTALKEGLMDVDDLTEKELGDGIELAVEDAKNRERHSWSEMPDHQDNDKDHDETREEHLQEYVNAGNAEDGKMVDDASPLPNNGKRKMGSPAAGQPVAKRQLDSDYHNDLAEKLGKLELS